MFGITLQPPDATGEASDSGLAPGGKLMQALLIAAIAASSLSLLFSIGTAALSGGTDQSVSAQRSTTQPGTPSSREQNPVASPIGWDDTHSGCVIAGALA